MKTAQNKYYRTIYQAKKVCWQKFFQGEEDRASLNFIQPRDRNGSCTGLKFTKLSTSKITLFLNYPSQNTSITIIDKEALVQIVHFLKHPPVRVEEFEIGKRIAHQEMNKESVKRALFEQQ